MHIGHYIGMSSIPVFKPSSEILDAEARVLSTRGSKTRILDSDIDIVSTAWRSGFESAAVSVIVEAMVRLVLSKMGSLDKGWIAHRQDECISDIRLWVLEQLSEFVPGKGAFVAMIAERSSWIISTVNRRYSQGGGEVDRSFYQIRAAALAEKERILSSTGCEPSIESLREATRERLIADTILNDSSASRDPFAARGRAIAVLKKSGKFAALSDLSFILEIGESDDSLDRVVLEEDGYTVGDLLVAEEKRPDEEGLESLYNLCLGPNVWARGILASHLGLLGDVEGISSLSPQSSFVRVKGLSKSILSDITGVDKSELYDLVKSALNRAVSPHAHWSHLAFFSIELAKSEDDLFIFNSDIFVKDWLDSNVLITK